MKVEIIRIEARADDPGAYRVVAKAFDGWRDMGYAKHNVIQSNWTIWHGLGMWRWYKENPDEMTLHLHAKDELGAFEMVTNWERENFLTRVSKPG